jgi:hypothetical protein
VELEPSVDPAVRTGAAIPTEQIGKQDAPLMAEPTNGFKTITVDGVAVTVPDYSGDLT